MLWLNVTETLQWQHYRSGTVNSNTVNSKIHLIRSYCEKIFYNFPNISCLKYTVNSNFHLIRSKTLPANDFELTVPDLYSINSFRMIVYEIFLTSSVKIFCPKYDNDILIYSYKTMYANVRSECASRGAPVPVNFGCFLLSRFSHFYCNAMRKTIKVHKNLCTNQQTEHTPVMCSDFLIKISVFVFVLSNKFAVRQGQKWFFY